jgi:hypothetical protein
MPTLPIEPITSASASRTQAWRESGLKAVGLGDSERACTVDNFLARDLRVKQHGAILGMQMQRNRASVIPGRCQRVRPSAGTMASNPESRGSGFASRPGTTEERDTGAAR